MEADAGSYERVAYDVFVYGSVSLALAMAKEIGLVHCLCTAHGPLTAQHMATQLTLKERYVREMLNSLTVGGLVQLEEGTGGKEGAEARYWVPPTCRQTLQYVGALTINISCSAKQYADVRKCFDLEGPTYVARKSDTYDESTPTLVNKLAEALLLTPGLTQLLERGIKALEVGCGPGKLFLHLAAMFPNSHFTLTNLTPEPLEDARWQADKHALTNVAFYTLDIYHMPGHLRDSVDWLLSSYVIHDLPHPGQALLEIRKALKPGGHFSLMDFFVSSYVAENMKHYKKEAVALYTLGTFNCIPLSYQHPDSEALGACWGIERVRQLVDDAGMKILGLTKTKMLDSTAVCMCQKPE
ncbi:hypothetical protein ACOMHN_009224 [Nucella lapillus]